MSYTVDFVYLHGVKGCSTDRQNAGTDSLNELKDAMVAALPAVVSSYQTTHPGVAFVFRHTLANLYTGRSCYPTECAEPSTAAALMPIDRQTNKQKFKVRQPQRAAKSKRPNAPSDGSTLVAAPSSGITPSDSTKPLNMDDWEVGDPGCSATGQGQPYMHNGKGSLRESPCCKILWAEQKAHTLSFIMQAYEWRYRLQKVIQTQLPNAKNIILVRRPLQRWPRCSRGGNKLRPKWRGLLKLASTKPDQGCGHHPGNG